MRGGIAPPKLGQTWAEPSKLRDKVKAFWATGRSAPGLAFRPGLGGGAPAVPRGNDINHLDRGGKGHGEIDVAAWDMEMHAVGDERGSDQQQEGEREHLRGRMALDKGGNRLRGEIHDEN